MSIYGLEHILYLVISIIVMIGFVLLVKFLVPKNKLFIVMKVVAGIGLILIIINRVVVAKSRNADFISFLPDTFCSMMGFILPIVVLLFKPTTKIFQYAIFSGMIGGLLTLFYPDFLVYFDNIFNIHPFTGLLYHTFMLLLFLIALFTGYFVPTFKNWTALPIGLAFMVVFAVFGNSVLGQSNNMYLNSPLISGTIFTWWFVGILFILLYTIIIQIYEMIKLPVKEWTMVKFFSATRNKINNKKYQDAKN